MPNNSEQFWTWSWSNTATLPTTLVPGWVIGTDTVSVTAAVSHIVSVMEYFVHTVATLATGTNLRTRTRPGSLACVDVFRVNYYLVFRWSQNKYSPK